MKNLFVAIIMLMGFVSSDLSYARRSKPSRREMNLPI